MALRQRHKLDETREGRHTLHLMPIELLDENSPSDMRNPINRGFMSSRCEGRKTKLDSYRYDNGRILTEEKTIMELLARRPTLA